MYHFRALSVFRSSLIPSPPPFWLRRERVGGTHADLMSAPTHYVHDLSPHALRIGESFAIHWYGLAYVAGFLAAFWLLARYERAGRSPLGADARADAWIAVILGVMIGGRLGSVLLYHPEILWTRPWEIVMVWKGGMASHGGMVGVALAAVWIARRNRIPVLQVGDLLVSVAALGIAFGRLANFINGELWGKVSNVSWAVIFPASQPGWPVELIAPRHPSQLYQAALEGFLLFAWMQLRFWTTRPGTRPHGWLTGEFLIGYAILRMVAEIFREPDAELILGLSRGTFYSLFVLLAGIVIAVACRKGGRDRRDREAGTGRQGQGPKGLK